MTSVVGIWRGINHPRYVFRLVGLGENIYERGTANQSPGGYNQKMIKGAPFAPISKE